MIESEWEQSQTEVSLSLDKIARSMCKCKGRREAAGQKLGHVFQSACKSTIKGVTYMWVRPSTRVGAEDTSTPANVVSVHWGQGVTGMWMNPPPSARKKYGVRVIFFSGADERRELRKGKRERREVAHYVSLVRRTLCHVSSHKFSRTRVDLALCVHTCEFTRRNLRRASGGVNPICRVCGTRRAFTY